MPIPEENFEIALDDSRDTESREQAIHALHTANECGKLAELLQRDEVESQFRERAVEALADPQCKNTLKRLLERGDVPEQFHEKTDRLLEETPDHTGGGP